MEDLMLRKRQGRTTHAYRVLKRYGGALRSEGEVMEFLRWMEAEGLAASTRSTILSSTRSVQPANKALWAVQIKVPHRSVQEEVLSKCEIQKVLDESYITTSSHQSSEAKHSGRSCSSFRVRIRMESIIALN